MNKGKLLLLFFIIFIFSFSWSFQDVNHNKKKEAINYRLQQEGENIRYVNASYFSQIQSPEYTDGQVLVKFKSYFPEHKIEAAIASYRSKKLRKIPRINVYTIQIPEDITVEEMVFSLNQNPDVEYAEPNYKVYISITPNDRYFRDQYALSNTGQELIWIPGSPQGKPKADIKATSGWEETKGDKEVIIAVLDTGVDMLHPDIDEKVHSSGWDFVNNDFDATDDHWHGTHVSGIAAAETNNEIGIAGVAWECKILPVKVLDKNGEGDIEGVSNGIIWATDKGADVINMSFGGVTNLGKGNLPRTLQSALKDAYDKDVVLAAAAGNDGGDVNWPASSVYCLAVAATNYNDERVTFANTGGVWESNSGTEIDVAAPGEGILSLYPIELTPSGFTPYAYSDGTSMATAHVSGLAALLKSVKPWLTNRDIMDIIRYSAEDVNSDLDSGKDDFLGYGRIDLEIALVPLRITSSK
ncbi:MAG: S8 family peptidase [Candidatus Aminicenantaceae bacterium]